MPDWYWWLSGGLAFVGSLLIAYAEALDWTARTKYLVPRFGLPGFALMAWGAALVIVGGLTEWLT